MAERTIVWTETAVKQRKEILKYWTLRNQSTAYPEKLIKLIAKRTKLIAKNPQLFKSTDFRDTRISAMGHFSILYIYSETQLIITAFWDNRQDPKKLLALITKKKD
jgi:plasmid stabilization system protein ParE